MTDGNRCRNPKQSTGWSLDKLNEPTEEREEGLYEPEVPISSQENTQKHLTLSQELTDLVPAARKPAWD